MVSDVSDRQAETYLEVSMTPIRSQNYKTLKMREYPSYST